jgi:hypothetical protein
LWCAASLSAYTAALKIHREKQAAARQKQQQQEAQANGNHVADLEQQDTEYCLPLKLLNNAAVLKYR